MEYPPLIIYRLGTDFSRNAILLMEDLLKKWTNANLVLTCLFTEILNGDIRSTTISFEIGTTSR